ncbi:hypothetical protein GPECTOR_33g589 [Gonium pectorale]|uniref:Phosphoribulokinase/uridine kinase domain-containing protein n=1 Tax=Gonium pectorale TaxID=33097 RepID=A0A150GCY5_GONPE|nr:hypothetical protein GPECTOR_33g589 [Gonium pectorale]|eukprot:KXZ47707.1 hypothetical protein GPECTOR_33g589 [Gonium pectorale]
MADSRSQSPARVQRKEGKAKGFYVFVRALQMLKSANTGTVVVGVAGPSGSGKTAFSEKVKSLMPGVALISMDMYNDGSKVIDDNFDDPRLTDYELLLRNLADLRDGKEVQIPIYDFRTSRRVGYRAQPVPEARVVIVEGIYALSERLRPLMDLRVSITGGVHFDLVKRSHGRVAQRREVDIYDIYLLPPNEDPETCQSWLRMRNRDGRYSLMFEEWVSEGPFIISPRISFEVGVRILGGLMALGYEIGTIMKRTSTILSLVPVPPAAAAAAGGSGGGAAAGEAASGNAAAAAAADRPLSPTGGNGGGNGGGASGPAAAAEELTVKLDDVGGLGRFVQILGRDRERVAALGRELGLEGSYIPRSYIEQVQLERLTAEFQTVTEDWKRKFSTKSGEVYMPDSVSGMMSPTRTSTAGNMPSFGRASYHGPAAPAMSTSAPVSGPIMIPPPQGAGSRAGSRVGSVQVNGGSLLTQQLAAGGAGGNGGAAGTPNSTKGMGGLNGALNGHSQTPGAGGSGPSAAMIAALQARLDELTGDTEDRMSALHTQMEAIAEQHRETNAQLSQLAAATSQLAASLQGTVAAANAAPAAGHGPAGDPWAGGLLGSPAGAAVAAGALAAAAVLVASLVVGRLVASRN